MYLSKLILNPSPAARTVVRDLADAYELHRTISRAFPEGGRDDGARVLYRLDNAPGAGRPPVLLVQSGTEPDWNAIQTEPPYLLEHVCKQLDPCFSTGQSLRFRLRGNATIKKEGKRVPLVGERAQGEWFGRKAAGAGFEVVQAIVLGMGRIVGRKPSNGGRIVHDYVDFDGILRVDDPECMLRTLAAGIGPAKAFGCGLLSLAPA
jgi:CRISPR system Cascade subunit CasE